MGLLVVAASAILLVSAGAGGATTITTTFETTPAELAELTVQEGVKNFAGPASMCPGPAWDCVTPDALPVVQTGTVNVIVANADDCAGSEQTGTVNKIECVEEQKSGPFAHQTCGTAGTPIVQNGPHNELICKLIYDVTTAGPAQCVVQEAHFEQTGVTNKFKAQFVIVQQMNSPSGVQVQDARQRIVGLQDAAEKNESDVEQVQNQKLTGGATLQHQNVGCLVEGTPPTGAPPVAGDCNPLADGPSSPYTCLNLRQFVAAGGDNISKLKQEVKEEAQTTASAATQQQGTPDGGNDGAVHQDVGGGDDFLALSSSSDPGKSTGVADQYTYQKLPERLGLVQSQFEDPSCCFASQLGGANNEEIINQVVQQDAGEDALQEARAIGQSTTPEGRCTIHHDLENNGGTVDETETLSPSCPFLLVQSACTSGGDGNGGPVLFQVTGTCTSTSSEDVIFE